MALLARAAVEKRVQSRAVIWAFVVEALYISCLCKVFSEHVCGGFRLKTPMLEEDRDFQQLR